MKSLVTRPILASQRPRPLPATSVASGAGLTAVLNGLFSGQELQVNGHDYIFAKRGQQLDSSVCLYTGIYVRSASNPRYVYVTVQLGVFLDFIERNLESCRVQLSPGL